MGIEGQYSDLDDDDRGESNFVPVDRRRPGRHGDAPDAVPVDRRESDNGEEEDKPDANYRTGLWVLGIAVPGGAVWLANTLSLWWVLAGAAAGGGLLYGAHRIRGGLADAKWRRRLGIRRSRRGGLGLAGKAHRAHLGSAPRARRTPRVKGSAIPKLRGLPGKGARKGVPKDAKAKGALKGATASGRMPRVSKPRLRDLMPSMPSPSNWSPRSRRAHQRKLDEVATVRSGKRSRIRPLLALAGNALLSRRWGWALAAALAAAAAALVSGMYKAGRATVRWLSGDRTSARQPSSPAVAATRPRSPSRPARAGEAPGAADAADVAVGDAYDTDQDTDLQRLVPDSLRPTGGDMPAIHLPARSDVHNYGLHPAMETLVTLHGEMFAQISCSVPNMIEHLAELGTVFDDTSQAIDGLAAHFSQNLPLYPIVPELMGEMSHQMTVNGDLARQTRDAYMAANPDDVAYNLEPMINQEWNNVGEGYGEGVDMTPYRIAVRNAFLELFAYVPTGPTDMRAWLHGMAPLFWQLESHIELAAERGRFPGAGEEISSFWGALAEGYAAVGSKGYVVAVNYEDSAVHPLHRHDHKRPKESVVDYHATSAA